LIGFGGGLIAAVIVAVILLTLYGRFARAQLATAL
jgi:hypothetical protein